MKSLILTIAKRLGLFAVASWMTRGQVRILAYHGVWYRDGHFGNHLFMSPEKFRARLAWLGRSKYNVVPLGRALDGVRSGANPPYATVITIDDGWYGTYRYMVPALEAAAMPATVYVYTGAVESQAPLPNILIPALIHLSDRPVLRLAGQGRAAPETIEVGDDVAKQRAADRLLDELESLNDAGTAALCHDIASGLGFDYDEIVRSRQFGMMTYEEVADAARRGIDIQLHTHSHSLYPEAPEKIADEIRVNREKLAPHVTSSLDHFCYPSGVNCPAMHPYLERAGVRSATLIDTGLVSASSHRFALKRILDGQDIDQLEFEAEMSGFLEILRTAKRALTPGREAPSPAADGVDDAERVGGRGIAAPGHVTVGADKN